MALKLVTETQYGIAAEYYKVLRTEINWYEQRASIVVGVFVSQEARDENKVPILINSYTFNNAISYGTNIVLNAFPFSLESTDNIIKQSYDALKTLPEFAASEDI